MKFVMFFLILNFLIVTNVRGQQTVDGFDIPPDSISVLLVPDQQSPLRISGPVSVTGFSNGALSFDYVLHNSSKANVNSFLIEDLSWFGGRGYSHPSEVNQHFVFTPSMTYSTIIDRDFNVTPFDKVRAEKAGVTHLSNRIWIVMIVKVDLSDGTKYDASDKFQELKKFVDKLDMNSNLSDAELQKRENQLRDFISTLMRSTNP